MPPLPGRVESISGLVRTALATKRGFLNPREMAEEVTVVDVLLRYLEGEGVDYVFGVPGGPLSAFFEALEGRRLLSGTPVPVGDEVVVNSYTPGTQWSGLDRSIDSAARV